MFESISGFVMDNILLTGSGAFAAIFILTKILPNKKLGIIFYKFGKTLSMLGRGKLGVGFYRGLRHWIEDTIRVVVNSWINGLGHFENKEKIEKDGGKVVGLKWDKDKKEPLLFKEGEVVSKKDIYLDFTI